MCIMAYIHHFSNNNMVFNIIICSFPSSRPVFYLNNMLTTKLWSNIIVYRIQFGIGGGKGISAAWNEQSHFHSLTLQLQNELNTTGRPTLLLYSSSQELGS